METTNTRVRALFSSLRAVCAETAAAIAMREVSEREDRFNGEDTSCFVRQSIMDSRRKAEAILGELNSAIEEARAAHKANILAEDPEIMSELSPENAEEIWKAILDCYEEDLWKRFFVADLTSPPAPAPAPAPTLPDLDIESMIAGERSWLQTAAREYAASPYPLHRMVAVGLVIRHSTVLTRAEDGISVPNAMRARAWAKSITAEQAESLRSIISYEADNLCVKIMDMGDDEMFRLDVQQDRDDLESVFCALSCAGNRELDEDIKIIDDLADAKGLLIASRSERYFEASIADPDAWWAFIEV